MPKPANSPESVMLLDMPEVDPTIADSALEEKWQKFLVYREEVTRELENARRDKTIGHSLDAAVVLYPDHEAYEILNSVKDDLARLFIVSQVCLEEPDSVEGLQVEVSQAHGEKCSRCWIYSDTVGKDAAYPELCERCATVMK